LPSIAKKPSTALGQEAEVGMKIEDELRMPTEPGANLGVLVGRVIVEDDVGELAGRDFGFDAIEETDELLMMTLHTAADARQIRCTALMLIPTCLAIIAAVQWVVPPG
jgi:hypothetical protein